MAVSSNPVAADSRSKNEKTVEVEMDRSEIRTEEVVELRKQVEVAEGEGDQAAEGPKNGGKNCHQCHQKIMAKAAGCKNMKNSKQCVMKFCEKCLLNRYGEKAEEKEALDNWECPKCRGICNCSHCRKRKGLKPTGILVHAAKKAGFSSVSVMLHAKGPEACQELIMQNRIAVSEGSVSSSAHTTYSPQKLDATLNDHAVEVVLPRGTLLTSVTGIDLLPEEVGYALQFLEFCSTFGEVLDIRKGQPEFVLRDITSERGRRKGIYSSAVQFLILLLSFILKDEEEMSPASSPDGEKVSWIYSLKKCISNSDCIFDDIPEDFFEQGFDGYEMLESSTKLKLLTFLCDETLCTIEMRTSIEDQHNNFVTKVKAARKTLNDAKEKEKEINLKLQVEVAKEVPGENRDLHTNSENDSKVSEIKAEAEQARLEIVETKVSVPKKKQRSDALRTQPIFLGDNGLVYWRLKCFTESELLLQDIEDYTFQPVSNEKWFSYDVEEKKVIEKHISSHRLKRRRLCKLNDPLTRMKNCTSESDHEGDSSSNDDSTIPPNVGLVFVGTYDDSTPTVSVAPPLWVFQEGSCLACGCVAQRQYSYKLCGLGFGSQFHKVFRNFVIQRQKVHKSA